MTWLDFTFIVLFLAFIAVGAKLGSLWISACLIGGFLGGFLVDYYALPVSGMIGQFPGSDKVVAVLLFAAGVAIALIPGWVLSRLSSVLILGVVDSVFGLVAGALAYFITITLMLLFLLPHAPKIEKSKAWKNSKLVKPFHHFVEDVFNDSHFRREPANFDIKDDFEKHFAPAMKSAEKTITTTSQNLVDKIRKKK